MEVLTIFTIAGVINVIGVFFLGGLFWTAGSWVAGKLFSRI